jgi:hypothetical protein
MKTKTTLAMVALIFSLVAFFVFRLAIFLLAEPGISLQLNGAAYLFSKNTLTIALWALLGFPAVVASIFVLWELRRGRAGGPNKGR